MTTETAAETPDWAIPRLLQHGERLILTGGAGVGKTVLCAQLAVAAAAGIHPFTSEQAQPQSVLWIDLENQPHAGRRNFRRLERAASGQGNRVPDGGLRLIHRPEGVDLADAADAAWLLGQVRAHDPDLLVIGPLYRMHRSDAESAGRSIATALDRARAATGCAVIVEAAHPIGSDALMTWPEQGIRVRRDGDGGTFGFVEWRAPRDGTPQWPRHLVQGASEDGWPWREAS